MSVRFSLCALTLLLLWATVAGAQGNPIIYPAKGQSEQQMEKDKFDCYSWAKKQSGFDPMQAQQSQPSSSTSGQVVKGAAVGAAGGAAIGAIAGNAGKGAAIGATSGALIGGIRKHRQKEQQDQAQQQQAAASSEYNRAYSVCLEGRGYAVK